MQIYRIKQEDIIHWIIQKLTKLSLIFKKPV